MKGATTATRNANPIPRASVRLDFQRRLRTPRVMMPAASNTSARRQAHGSSHGVPPNSYSFETTRGGAATIRPPASSYTNALKRQQIVAYGYPDTDPRGYEEDHLIALELGGAPSDQRNLWPEPANSPEPEGQGRE